MRRVLSVLVAVCLVLSLFTGVFAPVPVMADSEPSVHTDCPATSIGADSATLHGELDGLGGFTGSNEMHVYFQYRIVGADSWSQTSTDVHKSSTGDFSAGVTGLDPNTLYEFRAVAHGHDIVSGQEHEEHHKHTVEGSTCEFTTLNDVPSVHTDCPATNIGATSATLHGGLDGFGAFTGSNEMHVYFQYRIVGAGSWSSTSDQHQSSTGDFSATATGLDPNALYEFRAVAHGHDIVGGQEHEDHHKHTVEGSTCEFTTLNDVPSVHTDCPATNIGATSATLHGGLDGLGGFTGSEEIHVYFQYRIVGADSWSQTSTDVHKSSTGDFSAGVTGLDPNTLYEFRAVAHGHEHEGDEHDDHHHTVEGSTCQFTTLARAITVTAVADTKVYGAVDPIFAYDVSPPLEPGDVFTGALSHADHDAVAPYEDVGIYAITQGDLSAGSDYSITFVSRDFTVTPKPITVTAALSAKVYGAVDPVFAYYVDPALESGDAFTGALSHASHVATAPYENIGIYAITQGDLSAGSNYTITFVSADFTVATKPITVTAIANTKVYGNVDPTFAYNFAPSLEIGDTFAGALSHTSHLGSAPYENVGAYTITQGTLYAGPKYAITFVSASFSVTPRPITVTATAATKPFGFADPTFTYSVSEPGIAFTGKLGHVGHIGTAPYESAGLYAITQGTLSAGANYAITFVSRNLTVTPMTANVPPTIDLPDFSAWPGVTGWSRGAVPSFTTGLSPFPLQFTLGDDGGWVKWTIAVNGIIIVDPIGIGLITYDLPLSEGRNNVEITAVDEKGLSTTRSLVIYLDTRPPVISLSLPTSVSSPTLAIAGSAIDTGSGLASLSINGERVTTFLDGSFSEKIVLQKGANIIVVEAKDKEGNTASQTFTVKYAVASGSGPSSIYLVLTIGRAEMEVNGMPSPLSAAPFIKDGRTLLPIRALIEVLGGSVQWNASTRTATVLLGSRTVALTIGSTTALVNGTPITLDVAPEIKNGRTFLPLRAVAENLGLDLAWEPISRTISLTYWP